MEYAILTFVVIFLLMGSGLLLLFYREALGRRLAHVLTPRADGAGQTSGARPSLADRIGIRQRAESLGSFAGAFAGAFAGPSPKGDQVALTEPGAAQKRLVLAGYRTDGAVNMLAAAKVVVPLLMCAITVATGLYLWNPYIVFVVAVGVGYLLPDYWLDHRIKARAEAIRRGLPDLLDLLVVCLEAGLSLDQAALRSSEEMRFAHPVIADEIGLVMLGVRAGQPRLEAWKRLADRSNVDSVKMLVSILVQADQFGTGISKTLRTHGDTLRTQRRQRVEELAAKTTVKLVFPLVLFIFPSFLIVLLGSAIITISEAFTKR